MVMKITIDTRLVKDKTVREVERIDYEVSVRKNTGFCTPDVAAAAIFVWRQIRSYRYTQAGENLTIETLTNIARNVRNEFIHLHRVNYMTFFTIQAFYDWIDEKNLGTYNVRKYWSKCERAFSDYQRMHSAQLDRHTWMTVQDHMVLANSVIDEKREELFPVIRDYMIQKRRSMVEAGQKDDIELLHRIQVCLLFLAASRSTHKAFFLDIAKKHGVDFSSEFRYADLEKMRLNFIWMCEQMGVRFTKDKDADYALVGIDIDKSVRVEGAWDAVVSIITDPDIMDDAAKKAIEMNPETRKDYQACMEIAEKKAVEKMLDNVDGNFKIIRK